MLKINWRAPAAYRHTRKIPPAGFAWEYLRRNDDYREDFRLLVRAKRPDATELEAFARRWGLRFPARPRRRA